MKRAVLVALALAGCATPPPALPQPAAAAFAVPTTFGANITEEWYCVMTKLAPIAPISSLKNRKAS